MTTFFRDARLFEAPADAMLPRFAAPEGPAQELFIGSPTRSTQGEPPRDILARACRALRSGGFVFLGTGETTLNQSEEFERSPLEGACCSQPVKRG